MASNQSVKQLFSFVGAVAAIGASAFISQYVWRESGLKSLQAVNEQRVQLVTNELGLHVVRHSFAALFRSPSRSISDRSSSRGSSTRGAVNPGRPDSRLGYPRQD